MALVVDFLQNFVFIFCSIALFFLPFIGVFFWRNHLEIRRVGPHFNFFMERFFKSRESNALVFCWAAAEALVWFVIPEFLLLLVIFMKIRGKLDLVLYDIAGTIAGSLLALSLHMSTSHFLTLPYIREGMLTQVHHWYDLQGIWGLAHQPFSGVPYKVFLHAAPSYDFFIPLFLLVAIAARIVRYVVVYEATKALYPLLHRFVRKHYARVFILAVAIFTPLLMRVVAIYS